MEGTISSGRGFNTKIINADKYRPVIAAAYTSPNTKAVVLRVNCPGGSPTQSEQMYKMLKTFKALKPEVPLLCYVEDVCASGGYFIACAADEIHCYECSVIGSIGAIRPGFRVAEALEKMGVKYDAITSGRYKDVGNMFTEGNPGDEAHAQAILRAVHGMFMRIVLNSRGKRLQVDNARKIMRDRKVPEEVVMQTWAGLFEGTVYDGKASVMCGLADDLVKHDVLTELKIRFPGASLQQVDVNNDGILNRLGWLIPSVPAAVDSVFGELRESAMWTQFGVNPPS